MRELMLIVVTCSQLLVAGSAVGQVETARYERATFGAADGGQCEESATDVVVDSRLLKVQARAGWGGELRKCSLARREYIRFWAKAFALSASLVETYQQEILLAEGERKYWIPLQEPLVEPLQEELAGGGELTVFVVYAGCLGREPIFLATEFDASKPDS